MACSLTHLFSCCFSPCFVVYWSIPSSDSNGKIWYCGRLPMCFMDGGTGTTSRWSLPASLVSFGGALVMEHKPPTQKAILGPRCFFSRLWCWLISNTQAFFIESLTMALQHLGISIDVLTLQIPAHWHQFFVFQSYVLCHRCLLQQKWKPATTW